MKVVQVLQPQWLFYIYFISIVVAGVVDYASASQLQQQQKQLKNTEVNYTASVSSKFGAEIVVYPVATWNNSNNSTADAETSSQKQLFIDEEQQENKAQQRQEEGQNQQQKHQLEQQQTQKLQQEQETQQQQQIPLVAVPATDSLNNSPSTRVVRRLDETKDLHTQLVAAQEYDVPLAKKNLATNKSATNTSSIDPETATVLPKHRQRSASSRSNSRDSRKSAIATTKTATRTSQRSTSFDSQAQSARQSTTTRTQSGNAANVTKSQRRRNDDQRGKTQLRQSTAPTVSIDASTGPNVHKSRKEGSAINKSVSATVKSMARKSTVTSTSTSTPTTSTTVRPQQNFNFLPSNPFSFFSPSLWALSSPPKPASTKKPPKKYAPTPGVTTTTTAKVKKNGSRKNKVTSTTTATTTTTTTTTTRKPTTSKLLPRTTTIIPTQTPTTTQSTKKGTTDGPFRIALPTFSFFGAQAPKSDESNNSEKDKRNTVQNLRTQFNCPLENVVRFQLFPKICKTDGDCTVWNRNELCCEIFGAKSCVSGVIKPLEETSHTPILGLIPRKCPSRPLAELWWQVQECKTDTDCWPRVCCPDGNKRYCRTSQPELETVPVPVKRSFNYLSEYLECTPAPPPIFDLHPKTCESTLDCFPNVCCQEAGLRYCRPPKKSLLTWMANILNVDFVKRFAQNIVIK